MDKRIRQYCALIISILVYYLIHEGAHFLVAVKYQCFDCIKFLGLGIQVDIYRDLITDKQLGVFCIAGGIATLIVAYVMVFLIAAICKYHSKLVKAASYYITTIMLVLDPLYLSILCCFFGGGDMNGIGLLIPEWLARVLWGLIFIVNGVVFLKRVRPNYIKSFSE